MKKLWLLAVPVAMSLVLAGCEQPLGKYEVKAPNGKIYDKREWICYTPQYSDPNGVRKMYVMKNVSYLARIGKPVPKDEAEYMYAPVPGSCLMPASDTPVFRSMKEEFNVTRGIKAP